MLSGTYELLLAALKNPLQVSTIFESGPRVGRWLADPLASLPRNHVVVELGVGSGSVTEHLVAQLSHPAQYVGFEVNDDLCRYVEQRYPDLEIHAASAVALAKTLRGRKVGAVVSTLPWSLLDRDTRNEILRQIQEVLEPGGTFSAFLAMHRLWTSSMRDLWAELKQRFPRYTYTDEIWNLPPCRLYCARQVTRAASGELSFCARAS
jgi:phosphatidylethanolamine/phosphatidyl-N-methylethanolamine N-methyltransferase